MCHMTECLKDNKRFELKYLKDNKQSRLHLVRKCAQIFVVGYYLFLKAHCYRYTVKHNYVYLSRLVGACVECD